MHLDLQKKIPGFVTEKGNIIRLILFTATFALLFVNFYSPFGVRYWFNVTKLQLFLYSSLIILTGVLVVVLSRWLMFFLSKYFQLTYWQFFTWIAAEVFFMALFYAIFEKIFFDDERQFGYLLKTSMQNTALVLLLPYSAMWLYFSYREKKQQLEQMVTGDSFPDLSKNLVPFHDEKGILRLSVKKDHLLYLESSDNYVNIYYQNKDKISKFLLRNTMKKMEEIFQNSEIIRCHRCFMVNFEKVKVLRKDKEGLQLELDIPTNVDIPVSRSYIEKVMVTFSKYSANY
jgi:hypothetical protein